MYVAVRRVAPKKTVVNGRTIRIQQVCLPDVPDKEPPPVPVTVFVGDTDALAPKPSNTIGPVLSYK